MVSARHIFAVSDGTGATCEMLVQAALTQFSAKKTVLERVANVRTTPQVVALVERAAAVNGVIVFTMVQPALRDAVQEQARRLGVPTLDVLGPILTRLSDVLELSPMAEPGLLRHLDAGYYARIEAVGFSIKHDDGLGLGTLHEAEIVLCGVSRTSKSPTSVYLAYRGWRAGNVPVVDNVEVPAELLAMDQRRIVGLTIRPDVLQSIRENRRDAMRSGSLSDYVDPAAIRRELTFARRLFERQGWPLVDVTHKSIEEIATEVMRIITSRTGVDKPEAAAGSAG